MKRKLICGLSLFSIILCVAACTKENVKEEVSVTIETSTIETSAMAEVEQEQIENLEGTSFTTLKDVISAKDYIRVTEVIIPENINGYDVDRVLGHIEDNRCVVKISANVTEYGIVHYFTGEYEKLFSGEILSNPEADFYLQDHCDGKMILMSSAPGMVMPKDAKLWIYDFADNSLKNIYTYHTEADSNTNVFAELKYVMTEDGVYFADATDCVNIYFYDYEKEMVELHREGVRYPVEYKDAYVCLMDEVQTGNYVALVDTEGNVLCQIGNYGIDVEGNGEEIFIASAFGSGEMEAVRSGIMNLEGEYIFTTDGRCFISDVTKKSLLPQISAMNEGYPFLYDLEMNKILCLDNMEKCTDFSYVNVSGDGDKVILQTDYFRKTYLLEYTK